MLDEPVAMEEAPQEVQLEPEPVPELAPEPEPAPEPAPAPAAPPQKIGGGGSTRIIMMGKVRGDKKQAAADLMSQYLGISIEEAIANLNKKSVNTMAKDLTPDQAEECRQRYNELGIKVTVK